MVVICVDRDISIVYPFSDRKISLKKARIIVGIVWMISLIYVGIPVSLSFNMPGYLRIYTYNSMSMANNYEISYFFIWMVSYLSIIAISWFIMIILYIRAFLSIANSGKNLRKSPSTDNHSIAIQLSLILLTDFISWLPYYYFNLYGLLSTGRIDLIGLQFVGIFALPINSAINPFLYTIINVDILKK